MVSCLSLAGAKRRFEEAFALLNARIDRLKTSNGDSSLALTARECVREAFATVEDAEEAITGPILADCRFSVSDRTTGRCPYCGESSLRCRDCGHEFSQVEEPIALAPLMKRQMRNGEPTFRVVGIEMDGTRGVIEEGRMMLDAFRLRSILAGSERYRIVLVEKEPRQPPPDFRGHQ